MTSSLGDLAEQDEKGQKQQQCPLETYSTLFPVSLKWLDYWMQLSAIETKQPDVMFDFFIQ